METTPAQQKEPPLSADFSAYVQHESWTRQQLEDYQAQALYACRAYAYAHSPFYQRFHKGLMDRPLHELPVLTKAMAMEHFDELVTDRELHLHDIYDYMAQADKTKLLLDRYRLTVTSGTTGQPAFFLNSRVEGVTAAQALTRVQTWAGITPKSRLVAVTSPLPIHITAQFPPPVINGEKLAFLQLPSTLSRETLVERLNEWKPDVLMTYPSIITVLAHEQREGRLRIPLRVISCTGETLTHETRLRIEETWNVKMFNTYATSEGGIMAGECSFHQGLHLFEDFSIVEVVDKDNRPIPPGGTGDKILLTVLFRRTQPLIRYEIGDLVRLSTSEPCRCGRPFARVEAITGRSGEALYFPAIAGGKEGITTPHFETIFDALPLSRWQIVQEHDGLHILLLGASEELRDEQVLDLLHQLFVARGAIMPPVEIQRVTALVQIAVGKTPMLISRISNNS